MIDTYHLISLGCAKNLVDSEVMLGALSQAGFELCEEPSKALYLIVNTCGFIQPAVEEAIDEIMILLELKDDRPEIKVIVVGCLVERYRGKLVEELPEVDLFLGTEAPHKIAEIIQQLGVDGSGEKLYLPGRFLMSNDSPRVISTPFFRSWLKITEGCSNNCSYCMIPSIRGPLRSRAVDDLVNESLRLQEHGVKELSIIAQDTTAFGDDANSHSENLVNLLSQLLGKTDIPWLRVLYLYPSGINSELLELMAANPRLLPYLDIPMQHVNTKVLKAMNRHYDARFLYELLLKIRSFIPDIALRTTFLVGFPGETEKDFLELVEFMQHARLDHVGVFTYANEEGCPAEHMTHQVPEKEKMRRRDHLLKIQMDVAKENLLKYVGKTVSVLVEGVSAETDLLLEGRMKYQAADVDGCVYINDGTANPGDIVQVKISESTVYDLVGGIV